MSERKVAFAILAILILQVSVPVLPVDATSGRTTPDFSVTALTFSSGGSIDDAGQNILAPATHTVRIVVQNIGVAEVLQRCRFCMRQQLMLATLHFCRLST